MKVQVVSWLASVALLAACDMSLCEDCLEDELPECDEVSTPEESHIDYEFTAEQAFDIAEGSWAGSYEVDDSPLQLDVDVAIGDGEVTYGSPVVPGDPEECAHARLEPLQITVVASDERYSGTCRASVSDSSLSGPEEAPSLACVRCFQGVYAEVEGEHSVQLLFCDDESLWAWIGPDGEEVHFRRIGARELR